MSLMAFGGFLTVVGLCDLLRADRDKITVARRWTILGVGVALFVPFLLWAAESFRGGLMLGVVLVGTLALWLVGSSAALDPDRARSAHRWRAVAFAGLGLGMVVSLLGASALDSLTLWPSWMQATVFGRWPAADVTVSAGAVLLQLATGNLLVRLVLDAAGVPATANEGSLKGGRLLGPMERVVIVGLGHIGEVTAAAIVLAAKGLLRLPGLQAGSKAGPSDVTEYFLIGSFASWLIGFVGMALIYIA